MRQRNRNAIKGETNGGAKREVGRKSGRGGGGETEIGNSRGEGRPFFLHHGLGHQRRSPLAPLNVSLLLPQCFSNRATEGKGSKKWEHDLSGDEAIGLLYRNKFCGGRSSIE